MKLYYIVVGGSTFPKSYLSTFFTYTLIILHENFFTIIANLVVILIMPKDFTKTVIYNFLDKKVKDMSLHTISTYNI